MGRIDIVLNDKAEKILRNRVKRKGDMSKYIEELILLNLNNKLINKSIDEFFRWIVHTNRDWKVAELKYEGWNDRVPNLIKLLKKMEGIK